MYEFDKTYLMLNDIRSGMFVFDKSKPLEKM